MTRTTHTSPTHGSLPSILPFLLTVLFFLPIPRLPRAPACRRAPHYRAPATYRAYRYRALPLPPTRAGAADRRLLHFDVPVALRKRCGGTQLLPRSDLPPAHNSASDATLLATVVADMRGFAFSLHARLPFSVAAPGRYN